jgi:hypothetical protein
LSPSTGRPCSPKPTSQPVRHFLHAAVPDRRRMRQYGCERKGTKASSRREADAARDARGRCAPRRPRPRARSVRRGRATRTHVSRSSRRNRSDVPRSHVTPTRMRSCARCRSRAARDSRSIVSSSPARGTPSSEVALRSHRHDATTCGDSRALRSGVITRIPPESAPPHVHGKEAVDGSSPSEGFAKAPANRDFSCLPRKRLSRAVTRGVVLCSHDVRTRYPICLDGDDLNHI